MIQLKKDKTYHLVYLLEKVGITFTRCNCNRRTSIFCNEFYQEFIAW